MVRGVTAVGESYVNNAGGKSGMPAGIGRVDAEFRCVGERFIAGSVVADGANEIGREPEACGVGGQVERGAA